MFTRHLVLTVTFKTVLKIPPNNNNSTNHNRSSNHSNELVRRTRPCHVSESTVLCQQPVGLSTCSIFGRALYRNSFLVLCGRRCIGATHSPSAVSCNATCRSNFATFVLCPFRSLIVSRFHSFGSGLLQAVWHPSPCCPQGVHIFSRLPLPIFPGSAQRRLSGTRPEKQQRFTCGKAELRLSPF